MGFLTSDAQRRGIFLTSLSNFVRLVHNNALSKTVIDCEGSEYEILDSLAATGQLGQIKIIMMG